ncbi:unnamed protein product [Boreogadus saida]
MASHMCIFCGAAMDSSDGHRECPGCLGRAHLRGDVKNPCPAALDLPLEERARRAGLQAALVSLTDSSSTHGGQSYGPEGSLLGVGQDQGNPEGGRSGATSYPGDSTSGGDGTDLAGTVDLAEKVLTAAKMVGLTIPVQGASPADGVWAGIAQSRPKVSLPAADDFCQMLRKTRDAPSKPCQFTAGCRKLARASYPPETGLGDMPPVEREMAALTSAGPPRLTHTALGGRVPIMRRNARAARSGNALAVLLAAVRKTVGAGDQDTKDLMDTALSALAQMTRDVGSAMSSAILAHRQIWLAQTALPESVRAELINMPVLPAKVLHPDSQSVRARKGVKRHSWPVATSLKSGVKRSKGAGTMPLMR